MHQHAAVNNDSAGIPHAYVNQAYDRNSEVLTCALKVI